MYNYFKQFANLKRLYCVSRNLGLFKSNLTKRPVLSRNYCDILNVNTNVVKDVILFKYDNPSFYKWLSLCSIAQFGFWAYLSHFAFFHLKDAPVNEDEKSQLPWWRKFNLGENKYRNTIAICCFLIGYGILVLGWMYTLRSVRYLVLRKGGNDLTIVTYTPFGENRMMTVPLLDVCCKQTRQEAPAQLPIKVRDRYFHYILDVRGGEFKNSKLFDHTAGLKRTLRK